MPADSRLKAYREIADQAERGERATISLRVDFSLNTPGRIRAFVEAMETMGLTIEEWTIETFEAFYQKALRDARRWAIREAAEHLKQLRLHHSDNELDCVSDDALAFAANEIIALIEKEGK